MLLHDHRRHLPRDLVYLVFTFQDGTVKEITIRADQPVGSQVHGWTRDGAEITVDMADVAKVGVSLGVQPPVLSIGDHDGGG